MRYILHADDDASDRQDLKNLLCELDPGIVVIGFNNGLELMQYLNSVPDHQLPEMIFLDLRMPVWDGIKTLKAFQFRQRFYDIPIYMWSTSDTRIEMDLCIRLGAQEFITKPVKKEDWTRIKNKVSSFLKKLVL